MKFKLLILWSILTISTGVFAGTPDGTEYLYATPNYHDFTLAVGESKTVKYTVHNFTRKAIDGFFTISTINSDSMHSHVSISFDPETSTCYTLDELPTNRTCTFYVTFTPTDWIKLYENFTYQPVICGSGGSQKCTKVRDTNTVHVEVIAGR